MSGAPGEPAHPLPDPDGVATGATRRHAAPASPPPRSPWSVAVPLALAAVVVVALLGAWSTLQGRGVRGPNPVPVALHDIRDTTGIPGAQPTRPSASGTPSAPSGTTPPADPPATDPPSERPHRPRWSRAVPVGVLNATTRPGLAAQVAARLRARGWTVVAAANWWGGGVPRTAIFTTGHARVVRTLRHDVPAVRAVRAPLPGMSTDRLVLVLADDFPS